MKTFAVEAHFLPAEDQGPILLDSDEYEAGEDAGHPWSSSLLLSGQALVIRLRAVRVSAVGQIAKF